MRSCVCHFFVVTLQPKVAKLMSKTLKDRLDYLIALVSEFAATHHLSLQQAYLYFITEQIRTFSRYVLT